MRKTKLYAFLGIFMAVAVLALCAFSVSAKEKPNCYKKHTTEVSRETPISSSTENHAFKEFPILTDGYYLPEISFYNDPYLVRSQKWIRERNEIMDVTVKRSKLHFHNKTLNC